MELQSLTVHGNEVAYRTGGEGPVVLLIHGMAGSSASWLPIMKDLAPHVTYVAPDLPGHGHSDKPRGDYSLGAQAAILRDLMVKLGHPSATIVGQSLGGGIAMQLAYQHSERCERLVLVSAGGLGDDVTGLLRALTAPGLEYVMPIAFQPVVRSSVEAATRWASRIGLQPKPATVQMWQAYCSLIDPETRSAFLHTLRSVVDLRGQRVSARDRLYLTDAMSTMIIWGDHDPIIPVAHAYEAHEAMPDSRLEIMEGLGHFPHCEDPHQFARILLDFIDTTQPASIGHDDLTQLLALPATG